MLTVVLWLWKDENCKTQYTPEHANIAARMIHRHLSMPHRFVLMTDQPDAGFDPLIEPVKLWDDWRYVRNENKNWRQERPHCYVRLKAFSEEVLPIFGDRFVSIDLDCLVMDQLDPLFDRPEDFLIYLRPTTKPIKDRYQASMWYMKTGMRSFVWHDFKGEESIEKAKGYLGTDQGWMNYRLGLNEAGWTAQDGVVAWTAVGSDNRYLHEPPPLTRIIFFHGDQKPFEWQGSNTNYARAHNPGRSHLWVEGFYR